MTQSAESSYYRALAEAFDHAAAGYDDLYGANSIMAWMRQESLTLLQELFAPGQKLLEIGCGTGDEALALRGAGYHIVATDISPAMIDTARSKAKRAGIHDITWMVLPAGQLRELVADSDDGSRSFDGAYASFGALNCEPDLAPIADALHRLLRPGAPFAASLINRCCAWEMGWGLLHLRPRHAFRRLGPGWREASLATDEGGRSISLRYTSPRAMSRAFAPHFQRRKVYGLPVFLPPPDLHHLGRRYPSLFERLSRLDRRLRGWFPFHSLGDHFMIVLDHRSAQGVS